MKHLILLLLFIPMASFSQTNRDSTWLPLKPFIGTWKGEGGGEPGIGKYERSYKFILNNNFIEIKNKSTYLPTDKKPKGEVHEDVGYFIYDRYKKTFLLRQLHIEGFANDFILDSISPDKKTLLFISSAIVNIPNGWRAKETYRLISETEIEEVFELAAPNQGFELYSKVRLIKQ
ncbi:MAG: hypothetical protein JJE09_00715 [Bacteroidia bacterium]|nr:hypothetical protein [Bacteroidia bacterium]